ncbi:MAG: DUF3810 domain-containing protein, partial [Planctomycetes bacterium]|nr:DUF3810 domain-containing protein [Planctomycetota bacterium]
FWCVRLACQVFLAYGILWGPNHARLPLSDSAQLSPVEDRATALGGLARYLVTEIQRDQTCSTEPVGFGVFDGHGKPDPRLAEALEAAAQVVPSLAGETPALRELPFWRLYTRFGISGVFSPFTGEPHINGGVPDCRKPFVALHEIAHQRGFAREDEANFLGWLACASSPDAHYRYSGHLAALEVVLMRLGIQDPDAARAIRQALPPTAQEDMRTVRAFWKSYEGPARRVGQKVNDLYLKSQGQFHGVRSYGRMVELMLSFR